MPHPQQTPLLWSLPRLGLSWLLLCSFLLTSCGPQQRSQEAYINNIGSKITSESSTDITDKSQQSSVTLRTQQQHLLSEDYANFRHKQITNVTYTLSLDLSPIKQRQKTATTSTDIFKGKVKIDFSLKENNLSPITLDFEEGDINTITVNGRSVSWDYQHWYISLQAELFEPGENAIIINYQRPYSNDGTGLHKFTDPENAEVYLYTHFEPYAANRLFPHFDQPNMKAVLILDALVPASWEVIANKREYKINNEGNLRHWYFPPSAKISSYLFAIHAGPFTQWKSQAGDIELRLFARNNIAEFVNTDDWFIPTQQSFEFFQDYFNVPYPFEKYDQVIVPDFNAGAMENVAAVTFNERYISRGELSIKQKRRIASVISHEMAHMWFGDLVTMDWWNGLWLNESFASYMGNLALDRASDFNNIWDTYYLGDKLWAYETDQLITTHPVELSVPSTADALTNFDGITYGKGGSILKQLPFYLGEDKFRQGVSNYLQKYAYKNTSLDNFVNELALAAGVDLQQWQHDWLYKSGVNTLKADFSCDENNKLSSLRLIQSVPKLSTADKIFRSQRVQVSLYQHINNEMRISNTIPVTYSGAVTHLTSAIGEPCPDLVFPNEGDWGFVKIAFDNTSMATLTQNINAFSDTTTRIMLWQSLWDNVNDLQLPLTEFVNFALNNLAKESDTNVVRLVTNKLNEAAALYSAIGNQQDINSKIEVFFSEQLRAAQPNSELQKVWYDNYIAQAHSQPALGYLHALLEGTANIPGLIIDQDKRWGIIIKLNRYLYPDYLALVEREKLADTSDQGINMSLIAEATRPQTDIKKAWLERIIKQPDSLKLAAMRSAMSALFPPEQQVLKAQFSEQMLLAIPELSTSNNQEYLGDYAQRLSPALCTPESVVRLNQANKDFANLPPIVVKSYLIRQQQDQRCVALAEQLN